MEGPVAQVKAARDQHLAYLEEVGKKKTNTDCWLLFLSLAPLVSLPFHSYS